MAWAKYLSNPSETGQWGDGLATPREQMLKKREVSVTSQLSLILYLPILYQIDK